MLFAATLLKIVFEAEMRLSQQRNKGHLGVIVKPCASEISVCMLSVFMAVCVCCLPVI